ncbi:hypothetical protein CTheo_9196 [Ceratobasidium theobromae]|uniref:Galactose oxidase-like Early set domain-containing protein n=1 Tax=Ceratobasidium theobromae TaxID=1582974 RepID=A0A5N5Q7J0_9AGAM|nr:hypothetical protein CTheo_9196 [Ceratobasidium theobromae]
MGQRYIELQSSHTGNEDGSGVLHVSQLPPSAAIFPPGPALIFVVVNGVPSMGQTIMVGSGKIETQPVVAAQDLPESHIPVAQNTGGSSSGSGNKNSASVSTHHNVIFSGLIVLMVTTFFA